MTTASLPIKGMQLYDN